MDAARRAAPEGVELREIGDEQVALERLHDVEFLIPGWGSRSSLELLDSLPQLRVVQVLSAGTDWIENLVPDRVTLCNARGARDVPMAEWAVGALLGATSGLLRAARDRTWAAPATACMGRTSCPSCSPRPMRWSCWRH
jgi:phosphoglycerate dehydrogenase-like enzyme